MTRGLGWLGTLPAILVFGRPWRAGGERAEAARAASLRGAVNVSAHDFGGEKKLDTP